MGRPDAVRQPTGAHIAAAAARRRRIVRATVDIIAFHPPVRASSDVIEDQNIADITANGDETAGLTAHGRLVEGMAATGKSANAQPMPAIGSGAVSHAASVPPEPADAAASARPRTENSCSR